MEEFYIDDVLVDSRVTTVTYRVTPGLRTRKRYKLGVFYSIDKYIPEKGDVSFEVFDMFGNIVKGKEKDIILKLTKNKLKED